jgi:endo-1,4-beta-xylanase
MKSFFSAVTFALAIFSFGGSTAFAANDLPVLMFHKISDQEQPARENVQPAHFDALMKMLSDSGYTTVTATKVAELIQNSQVPEKTVALTFDDGWVSVLKGAEILNKYQMSGTFYIIGGAFGDSQYLSREQVRRLSQNPRFQIGAHSMSHFMKWEKEQDKIPEVILISEMLETKRVLDEIVVGNVTTLSWPFGFTTEVAVRAMISAGFTSQMMTNWTLGIAERQHDIRRINISGTCSVSRLQEILESKNYQDCN